MKFTYTFMLVAVFISSCAPPAGWKSRSRLFGPDLRSVKDVFKDGQVVRVLIYHGSAIPINSDVAYEFRSSRDKVTKGKGSFTPDGSGKYISDNGEFILNKNYYYGDVMIYEEDNKFSYINHLPIEQYLVSVVGHEMSPKWPLDALKAQAVVARTYVLQKIAESKEKLYDVAANTKDQVYGGRQENDGTVKKAIHETRAQVITYHGDLAKVFFHSCCGGETASSAEVWKEELPYLRNRNCNFRDSPEYNWELILTKQELEDKLGIVGLTRIAVTDRTESKRAKIIQVQANGVENDIPASEFRKKLGVEKLRSTRFGLKVAGNQVVIKGHGYGHGVGLCQWCSKIMAEKQSMKYRSILRYFFPGTHITKI